MGDILQSRQFESNSQLLKYKLKHLAATSAVFGQLIISQNVMRSQLTIPSGLKLKDGCTYLIAKMRIFLSSLIKYKILFGIFDILAKSVVVKKP